MEREHARQAAADAGRPGSTCGCAGVVHPLYAERFPLLDGLPGPSLVNPLTAEQNAQFDVYDAPFCDEELPEVHIEDAAAPGPHGPVPLRIYRPLSGGGAARPGLLWIHGGAFVFGDLDMPEADHTARRVAAAADAVVVSADYHWSLGGVHFPVPHDDCWAAYEWVRANASALGIDPGRIAVGGGSAGGNLAASVVLRARDEGVPPAQALLVYPALHPGEIEASDEVLRAIAMVPPALCFGEDVSFSVNYLGGPIETATPYAFPGVADSLAGFPPTYIENAEFDSLRASGEAFAAALARDGVDVELGTACGVPHGHLNRSGGPGAAETCARLAERLRRPS